MIQKHYKCFFVLFFRKCYQHYAQVMEDILYIFLLIMHYLLKWKQEEKEKSVCRHDLHTQEGHGLRSLINAEND